MVVPRTNSTSTVRPSTVNVPSSVNASAAKPFHQNTLGNLILVRTFFPRFRWRPCSADPIPYSTTGWSWPAVKPPGKHVQLDRKRLSVSRVHLQYASLDTSGSTSRPYRLGMILLIVPTIQTPLGVPLSQSDYYNVSSEVTS